MPVMTSRLKAGRGSDLKGAQAMYHRNSTYITPTGFQDLKTKLTQLDRKRSQLGHELHEAQEPGRKLENGSYSAIWEEKLQIEETIHDINSTLREAILIRRPTRRSKIMLGSTVKLKGEGQVRRYTLVDSLEADPSQGMLSYKSPAGNALIGKRIGDQVEIGNGTKITYTVIAIE